MDKDYEISGFMKTNEKGDLMIASKSYFDQFFRDNPNSSFTFKVVKNTSKSKKSMIAYFHAEVAPKLISGFRDLGTIVNKEELIIYIMDVSSFDENKSFEDLNYFELRRLINEIIIFASENLQIVIEEPI